MPQELSSVCMRKQGGVTGACSLRITRVASEVIPLLGVHSVEVIKLFCRQRTLGEPLNCPTHQYKNKDGNRGQETLDPAVRCDLP